ncbi:MAG TPA: single-stranded-DNA-specific exonuclease RecJ [Solirubrobacterales bacterium]|nr:single-stranded-DNA-specific exonuclease RecJ [Solirubrobacterales bacterium]
MPETLKDYAAAPYSYAEARALADELGLSEPVAVTLVRRGYRTPEQARAFLSADESHPPAAFRSMEAVLETVLGAVEAGSRITVYGDFDVDGVCATTIMVSTLRRLGADCDWLIPDRIADGYGLSKANVELLAKRGTELLITVDCGVTAVEEVALATELGMEVVITDHHQRGETLPNCLLLHPSLDGYPFEHLCGTAVAWKLATALREASGMGSPDATSRRVSVDPTPDASLDAMANSAANADLDLVALATVADVVPLVGENRALVKRGLAEIRRAQRPGIRALLEASKCEPTRLDEGDLAFRLAPRINAAGRLYRADAGVELFLAEDAERAKEIAVELGRANSERRAAEREVDAAAEKALRELPEELRKAPGYVVAGEGWHPGVIGIVASRLVERHHRPVVVVSLDGEGGGRGSGRSIPGFDLHAALEACSQHLEGFGGHKAAAGLQLRAEDLDDFRAAFAAHAAATLRPEDLRRTERVDAMVGGAGLGLDLAEELGQLAPFGMGNPGVRLLVPGAKVSDVRTMGEGKHARFSLHSGSHRALGVAFGKASLGVGDEDRVDATVRLEVNHWNGSVEPRVVLRELYPLVDEDAGLDQAAWWDRFEAELQRDPAAPLGAVDAPFQRRRVTSANAPAAILAELASSGGRVLALVADAEPRAAMETEGVRLADYLELERGGVECADYDHVVLVDPPPSAELEELAAGCAAEGAFLHCAWGEAEWRFACHVLGVQLPQRPALIELFRDLREADGAGGEQLLAALRGGGPSTRSPEAAARGFRVLAELGLVAGSPDRGDGTVGVVSSGRTELERSAAFRAYRSRYEECRQYLERRQQP